jgi:hypothetical protein
LIERESENEVTLRASAMLRKVGKPAASDRSIDGAEDGGTIYAKLFGDRVVTGIALAILLAMQAEPDQHDPVDDGDAGVVAHTAHPVEGFEFGVLFAHWRPSFRSRGAGP